MKLVLINPKFPESFWSFSWALDKVTRDKKAVNSPLGLATLAGLTPPGWEITIIDENVEPIDWSLEADIVGVCGMAVQVPRQKEILGHFRKKGLYVVAGGSYASLCPEEYAEAADSVIAGEAERIWPQFLADYEAGRPQRLYRETGEVDLTASPPPRYDLLKLPLYQKVSIQFSRGCPFRCEFCDIIVMFGRRPRTKSLEQVGRELDLLRGQGMKSLFFVDDNFIGDLPKAKKLLAFLADYQERHHYRFSFGTEVSINLAADRELMTFFREANFEWVFIGIETPNEEGLRETLKRQNLQGDLLVSVRTIYSHGIDIFAGFIVGFDADDRTIFDRQFDFIVASGIAVSMVALLSAIPKTPLYGRLKKAGRLRTVVSSDNTRPATNVIPLKMTYDELIEGYEGLQRRLTEEKTIYRRLANKVRHLKDPLDSPHLSPVRKLLYLSRLVFRGILPGGFGRIYWFVRSVLLALCRPKGLATTVTDWIAALSLQAFQDRHFGKEASPIEPVFQRLRETLRRKICDPVQEGVALRIAALQEGERIWIDLKKSFDRRVAKVLSRAIRRTLKRSREGIVIDCRTLKESSWLQIRILLKRLRRYRHQIHIQLPEGLYRRLADDLVPFQYTLGTA